MNWFGVYILMRLPKQEIQEKNLTMQKWQIWWKLENISFIRNKKVCQNIKKIQQYVYCDTGNRLTEYKSGKYIGLTLSLLAVNFEDRSDDLCKQFGSRWYPTKCRASSEIQIVWHSDYILAKKWVETINFLKILKETNIWKNYPACKELNTLVVWMWTYMYFIT